MSNRLNVCLFNAQPESSQELRDRLTSVNFVRLVGEARNSDELAETLHENDVNMIFFHLDPDPPGVVDIIDQVSTRYPSIAMIAASHQTAPEAILAPIRAGCDQFVCEPIDQNDLSAAVSRVARKRLLHSARSQCVCVTSASGGMGATTIACNLALELGQLTESTCALADLNLQFGDAATNFDTDPKYTWYDLAVALEELDAGILKDAMTGLSCNVALLPRPDSIDQFALITPDVVHRVVELLNSNFECVVIDMPRTMDSVSMAAQSQADVIVIVSQLLIPCLRNTKRYFDALCQAGIPEERIQIVVNRTTKTPGRVTEKDVEEMIGRPIYCAIPNDYEFIARSLDYGRPIAAVDRSNPVREAIREMARKIAKVKDQPVEEDAAKRGLFGRLLSRT